jgi:hypothetical protein
MTQTLDIKATNAHASQLAARWKDEMRDSTPPCSGEFLLWLRIFTPEEIVYGIEVTAVMFRRRRRENNPATDYDLLRYCNSVLHNAFGKTETKFTQKGEGQ